MLQHIAGDQGPATPTLKTGAKVGSKCTPKVLAITKPEEKWKQAKKGTAYT